MSPITKTISPFLFLFVGVAACSAPEEVSAFDAPLADTNVMPMGTTVPDQEACVGETCMCSTEDCIDVDPHHECDANEEGCEDSYLDLDLEPCTPDEVVCEEPFDSGSDGEDELDPGDDDEDDNALSIPQLKIRVQFKIGQDLVDLAEPVMDQQARAEVVRRGGYLADLTGQAPYDVAIPALPQRYERLVQLLGPLDAVLDATDGHLKLEVIYYRQALKSMAADVIGGLVQGYPFKRRLCRAVKKLGAAFRWRLGHRIMNERGTVWNQHLSPMVDAAITSFTDAANADLATFLDDYGIGDHVSATVIGNHCAAAPQNTTAVISSTAEPPLFDPTTIDLTKAGANINNILTKLQAGVQ